jgi:alpha-1,2-mannosyltransferase
VRPGPGATGTKAPAQAGQSASGSVLEWAGMKIPAGPLSTALILLAALVALGLRLEEVLRPGHLFGVVQYDDSVYLGAALRIVAGQLPYRDFVTIQPPGLPILLVPVAALAHWIGARGAMAVARLLVPVVSAVDVVLLGLLVRHRGPLVAGVACFALAAYPDDLLSAPTVYQEPFLNLFCLVGAGLAFQGDGLARSGRRLWLAGLVFGLGGAVKLWAVFPVVVLVILLWRRPRGGLALIAGAGVGFLVVCSPFLLLSAPAFVHQVLISQALRVDVVRVPIAVRLVLITGVVITNVVQVTTVQRQLGLGIAGLLAGFLSVCFLALPAPRVAGAPATRVGWWERRRTTALERFALGSLVLTLLAFMIPDDFYFHYATFLGPFLMLSLALAVGRLLPLLREVAVGLSALVLLGALMHALLVARGVSPAPDPAAALDRLIPPGACVVTDNPAYLISANRYGAGPGCPPLVDPYGATIDLSQGRVANGGAASSGAAVAAWRGYFERAEYLLLTPASGVRIPWTPALESYVERHFRMEAISPVLVLIRGGGGAAYSLPALAGAPP